MPRTPKVHYRRARVHAACALPWPPVPDGELTDDLMKVTCGSCRRTLQYRGAVAALADALQHDDGQAAAKTRWIQHELPGMAVLDPAPAPAWHIAVLNPEFLDRRWPL